VNAQPQSIRKKTKRIQTLLAKIGTHIDRSIDSSNVNHNMIKRMEECVASLILNSNG
jgi:hypothetical protein